MQKYVEALWSTATIIDSILDSYVVPLGPLLLLSHLYATSHVGTTDQGQSLPLQSSWSTVGRSWTQVYALFLASRAVGKVVGPSLSARVSAKALRWCGLAVVVGIQLWLGVATEAGGRLLLARAATGFASSVLCSGLLAVSRPEPGDSLDRSLRDQSGATRTRQDADLASRDVGRGGRSPRRASEAGEALRRADVWWHAGLVAGPAVGGWAYGRSFGLPWLSSRPVFLACVAVCLIVLVTSERQRRRIRALAGGGRKRAGRYGGDSGSRWWSGRRGESSGAMPGYSYGASPGAARGVRQESDEDTYAPLLGAEPPSIPEGAPWVRGGDDAADEDLDAEAGQGTGGAGDGQALRRYLAACGGDAAEARRMWHESLRWRRETGADRSLSTPQLTWDAVKESYPCFLHGRSRQGAVVVYERAGRMQFGRLAATGVTPLAMQMHLAFVSDFVFSKLNPSEEAQVLTVVDMAGFALSSLTGNTFAPRYLKAMGEVMEKHYPMRQGKVLVINAPWWLGAVWNSVSGVLSRGSRGKVEPLDGDFLPTLLEYMDASQIPPEYGGNSPYGLGSAPEEVALRELAESLGPTSLLAVPGDRSRTPASLESPRSGSPPTQAPPAPFGVAPGGAAAVGSNAKVGTSEFPAGGGVDLARRDDGTSPPRAGEGRFSQVPAVPRGSNPARVRNDQQDRHESGKQRPRVSQRLASAVRRMRGTSSGGATMAYLGVENRFRYDEERRIWVMDGEESEGIDGGAAEGSSGQDGSEQHLVRAIQAAQQARGGGAYMPGLHDGEQGPPGLSQVFSHGHGQHGRGGGRFGSAWRPGWVGASARRGSGARWLGGAGSPVVPVFGLHLAWAALESGTDALLPLWMSLPVNHGGLGWTAGVTGTALSLAAAMVVTLRWGLPVACLRSAARSPVRALRVAVVLQILVAASLSALSISTPAPCCKGSGAATLLVVAFAAATARASATLARPALLSLLGVALGHASAADAGAAGDGDSRAGGFPRRHPMRAKLAVGAARGAGVLMVGSVFARAVDASAGAGGVCFRLTAVAFSGLCFATMFVRATDGAGGGSTGQWRDSRPGTVPVVCEFVEEAADVHLRARATESKAWGGAALWGPSGTAKES